MLVWDPSESRGCRGFTPNMCCLKKELTLTYIESNHKAHRWNSFLNMCHSNEEEAHLIRILTFPKIVWKDSQEPQNQQKMFMCSKNWWLFCKWSLNNRVTNNARFVEWVLLCRLYSSEGNFKFVSPVWGKVQNSITEELHCNLSARSMPGACLALVDIVSSATPCLCDLIKIN